MRNEEEDGMDTGEKKACPNQPFGDFRLDEMALNGWLKCVFSVSGPSRGGEVVVVREIPPIELAYAAVELCDACLEATGPYFKCGVLRLNGSHVLA